MVRPQTDYEKKLPFPFVNTKYNSTRALAHRNDRVFEFVLAGSTKSTSHNEYRNIFIIVYDSIGNATQNGG